MADITAAGRRAAIARAGGRGLALAWPVIGGAMLGLSVAIFVLQPLWDDPSWYLYVASRWLAGAQLYGRELVDVDPPLIIWVSAIAVSLSHVLGVTSIVALKLVLAAAIAGSIAWSVSLVRRFEGPGVDRLSRWLLVALLYVFVVYVPPLFAFGQREHFLAILIMPYVTLTATRLERQQVRRWEAAAIGLLAAIAVCLKPHHVLIIAALEALAFWRLRAAALAIRTEFIAVTLGCLAYCAAVLVFTPDYLFKVLPLDWNAYLDWGRVPLLSLAYPVARLLKLLVLAALYAVSRRYLRHEALVTSILTTGCAALGAYVVQHKAGEYLILPAMIFFNLGALVIAIDALLRLADSPERSLQMTKGATLALAVIGALIGAAFAYRTVPPKFTSLIAEEAADDAAIGPLPAGAPIYEMTPDGFDPVLFDLIMRHDWRWASRFNGLWMLESIFEGKNAPQTRDRARADRLAAYVRNAVDKDFARRRPPIVFVERCADASVAPCYSMEAFRIDLPTWLMQDPRFRTIWSRYTFKSRIGRYDLYTLKSP